MSRKRRCPTNIAMSMRQGMIAVLLSGLLGLLLAPPTRGQMSAPSAEVPLGVGVVQVPFTAYPLYFYAEPASDPATTTPLDSLTFTSGPHHTEVAYAPPWLDPEVFKLDYDLFYFRAVSLRRHWVEVVVHSREVRWPPRTMWLDREAVTFRSWPVFLLEVFSVEPLDPAANPLRVAPANTAERIASDQDDYRPLMVQGEWMLVEGADMRETGNPRGWLRWRDGDLLLIRYAMLS